MITFEPDLIVELMMSLVLMLRVLDESQPIIRSLPPPVKYSTFIFFDDVPNEIVSSPLPDSIVEYLALL